MQIILHIGLHKTGSSALQLFFARNAANLAAAGVRYPLVAGEVQHHSLIQQFTAHAAPDAGPRAVAELLAEAAEKSPQARILISSEILCEIVRRNVDRFIATLAGHDVTAIAYLRRPDEMVRSAHNQMVRDVRHRLTAPPGTAPFAYDVTLGAALSAWIGRTDIRLVLAPYDPAQWTGGTIFTDFLAMIGVPPEGFDYGPGLERINPSLPFGLVEFLRAANRIPMNPDQHEALVAAALELHARHPDAYPDRDPLTPRQRYEISRVLAPVLPDYRPYFRPGFDESFLTLPDPDAAAETAGTATTSPSSQRDAAA